MISEFFINIGFKVAEWFFALLPDFEWSVTSSAWTSAKSILNGVCYFLPLDTVTAIISIIVSLAMVRISIKFIRTILEIITSFL